MLDMIRSTAMTVRRGRYALALGDAAFPWRRRLVNVNERAAAF